ncbi:two-component system response regulator [Vibrio navarrensis]|uniref:Transcriptional regulatory protein n=1 Tax=Vibrio navarrensis TaxID=29495 RepID=A0AAJ4I8M5_9VIBR|nr:MULTISPECIES: response regulator [Vibrio]KJR21492.1 chemotaxis protein CheY [Vibrio sp. S234-5]MBE3653507.1 two-component system response regulator [Vibrio navarrensis]MBE3662210.1 two-component system response regulator [Vibrio navarrensis]MBE4603169.1 two-component system response regulator [Vibrio navarrensis]QPL52383.1 response regulator [Vibrio navarrensis]
MSTNSRVMIIEDDLAIAQLHHNYLQQLNGFEVIAIATTSAEAQLQLTLLEPDLVLLDVYLPDGSGLNILNQIRGSNRHCDVILITAARDVETLQTAMRGGVVDYLLKPVMFVRLEAALNKYRAQLEQLGHVSADLNQGLVDKMLQSGSGQEKAGHLPKGIDGVTLDKIRALFQQEETYTADEAGEKMGASRTTARRYLEYLIAAGELQADLSYGTVGRPERCYKKVLR